MNKFSRLSLMLALCFAMFAAFGCTKDTVQSGQTTPAAVAGDTVDLPGIGIVTLSEGINLLESTNIYFAFDRYDLDEAAKSDLKYKAAIMTAFPAIKARIGGHCDERGTDEYNLALSERRATAVADYLIMLGARPAQLSTQGFGKMFPAAQGRDEDAWAMNRRAEFKVN